VVVMLLAASAWVMLSPLYRIIKLKGVRGLLPKGGFSVRPEDLMYVFFIGIAAWMLIEAQAWYFNARIGPTFVASTLIGAGSLSLIWVLFSGRGKVEQIHDPALGIHMDLEADDGLPPREVLIRAGRFLGWYLFFMLGTAVIGLIMTIPLMIIGFMRSERREPWVLTLSIATGATLFIWIVFDRMIGVPWPHTFLGNWIPSLRGIIPAT
jgi:Tripartite tricarboxylate transporter TctB family